MMGSRWFRRLVREAKRMSPHIRFKRIKYGFYRIYYRQAYVVECFKNMPEMGYDINEKNFHFERYQHYQDYHDNTDSTMRVKNFVEGYHETKNRLRTRLFQMNHSKEFYETARRGYSQMRIK